LPSITPEHVNQLITIESHVHYGQAPPPGIERPFVSLQRPSPVLLSAPHGARTHRCSAQEDWHEEDEYTAGLALLLSELCGTSVIATVWRSDQEDPNWHYPSTSPYKREVQRLVEAGDIRWVIDLHGMGETRLPPPLLVDLGTRRDRQSLPQEQLDRLARLLETHLGAGTVSHNVYSASRKNRTVTAYSQDTLGIHAVQVELKPSVRVPFRRTDASRFAEEGPFSASPEQVIALMQALAGFIELLLVLL